MIRRAIEAANSKCFGMATKQNNNLLRAKPLFRSPQVPLPSPFPHSAWSKKTRSDQDDHGDRRQRVLARVARSPLTRS
jgi:hypothetical protein